MIFTRRQTLALLAASDSLASNWRAIASEIDGTVGAAALLIEKGQSVDINGGDHFPLASVCKFPMAAHVMAMVAEGKFALDTPIEIPPRDLWPPVSVVVERYPKQKRFPLDNLVEWMVAQSDNTAVQTLWRLGGGTDGMAARLRQWNIAGLRLDRSERQCMLDAAGVQRFPPDEQWTAGTLDRLIDAVPAPTRLAALRRFIADPRDSATPKAAVTLLARLFKGELLPPPLTRRLMEIMTSTTTGPARIKGLLPPGTPVAHKTGTAPTYSKLNGATNDVGIVTLPGNAGHLAIAVFVKGSTRDQAAREAAIAKVAKAAWDRALTGALS